MLHKCSELLQTSSNCKLNTNRRIWKKGISLSFGVVNSLVGYVYYSVYVVSAIGCFIFSDHYNQQADQLEKGNSQLCFVLLVFLLNSLICPHFPTVINKLSNAE